MVACWRMFTSHLILSHRHFGWGRPQKRQVTPCCSCGFPFPILALLGHTPAKSGIGRIPETEGTLGSLWVEPPHHRGCGSFQTTQGGWDCLTGLCCYMSFSLYFQGPLGGLPSWYLRPVRQLLPFCYSRGRFQPSQILSVGGFTFPFSCSYCPMWYVYLPGSPEGRPDPTLGRAYGNAVCQPGFELLEASLFHSWFILASAPYCQLLGIWKLWKEKD